MEVVGLIQVRRMLKNIEGAMSMTLQCWILVGIFIALVVVLYEESRG